jgi:predicted 3-demethylubiquinone-9 3-methyltransferase (glyoxalase superfamily)
LISQPQAYSVRIPSDKVTGKSAEIAALTKRAHVVRTGSLVVILKQSNLCKRCGWLKDKYGLSWQINPTFLGEMLNDEDPEKSARVMRAMLQMDKIDIGKLKEAYEQR